MMVESGRNGWMGSGFLSWEIVANRLAPTVEIVLARGRNGCMGNGLPPCETLANRFAPTMES